MSQLGRLLAFFPILHHMTCMASIDVAGAGIVGLWQAYLLRRRGHEVTLWDPAGIPSSSAASRLAGAMLAPFCEGEPGHEVAQGLGIEAIPLWEEHYPGTIRNGTLVVAAARDHSDLQRFASIAGGYRRVNGAEISEMEPQLAGRFREGLFFEGEAHIEPVAAMGYLAAEVKRLGVICRSEAFEASGSGWVMDCRGLAAKSVLKSLRGVRGERIILECAGVTLKRPIRLLHPRVPFYIVPWDRSRFMIGATVIESEDSGPPTLRSCTELLSCAYALVPELGEARVIDMAAGIRPAFPDNTPKIIVRGQHIHVNGLYRHGFLAAPILAQLTDRYIESGIKREGVVFEDHGEW
ncbi:MAG: FAD-dependent oxidoreductase [Rhodomicrobium sp.]